MLTNNIPQFWSSTEKNIFHKVVVRDFGDSLEVFIDKFKEVASDGYFWPADESCEKTVRGEGDKEANELRAARRSRSNIRRRCKALGADVMMTLSYRENMQDFERLERDFKALRKRLVQTGLDFQYVAVVERQQRGALHLHIACRKLPMFLKDHNGGKVKSFRVLQALWRRVVGADNGTVNVTSKRIGSARKIASYIAKYVGKSLEDRGFNKKAYWSSRGIVVPVPVVTWWPIDCATPNELIRDQLHIWDARDFDQVRMYKAPSRDFVWFEVCPAENYSN